MIADEPNAAFDVLEEALTRLNPQPEASEDELMDASSSPAGYGNE